MMLMFSTFVPSDADADAASYHTEIFMKKPPNYPILDHFVAKPMIADNSSSSQRLNSRRDCLSASIGAVSL